MLISLEKKTATLGVAVGRLKTALALARPGALFSGDNLKILRAGTCRGARGEEVADHAGWNARIFPRNRLGSRVDDGFNMVVTIGIEREVKPALVLQHRREPRIVAPVGIHRDRAARTLGTKEIVDGIGLPTRIPARPQL